ncbi:MAG: tripartite tricarboxylate transporter substrate binding protein, partial [Burkholderiaceae bacterium]
MKTKLRTMVAAAVLSFSIAAPALADGWPSRPVRLIVPFAPGGSTDVTGRMVAQKLGEVLGQPVVVDNRPGAAGILGAEAAVRAPADGYTLLLGGGNNAVNANLYAKLSYDFTKDLIGVALIGVAPNVMVVPPALPVQTVAEFVAFAHDQRGQINYASSGNGATTHLSAELFKSVTGVEMTHIPYKGSSPALTDLMAGHAQVMFDSIISAAPLIRSGKLRALAVTSAHRNSALPEVPSLKEAGVSVEAVSYFGIYAPAGIPAPIAIRLNREIRQIVQ